MIDRRFITRWNISALLVILIGGAVTLLVDHMYLEHWLRSGDRFPIGEREHVELPAGRSLVYYQSNVAVPPRQASLHFFPPTEVPIDVQPPPDDNNFKVRRFGISGRALWVVDVKEAGTYEFACYNLNYDFDDVPEGDRIIFSRSPATIGEVESTRRMMHLIGASITIALALMLYAQHMREVKQSRKADHESINEMGADHHDQNDDDTIDR